MPSWPMRPPRACVGAVQEGRHQSSQNYMSSLVPAACHLHLNICKGRNRTRQGIEGRGWMEPPSNPAQPGLQEMMSLEGPPK